MSCSAHPDMEARWRDNRERIIKLESEVEHMNEKMDAVLISQKETKAGLDDLKVWQLKITVATGVIVSIVTFIASHWQTLAGLFAVAPK
jgi:hypothetical protein